MTEKGQEKIVKIEKAWSIDHSRFHPKSSQKYPLHFVNLQLFFQFLSKRNKCTKFYFLHRTRNSETSKYLTLKKVHRRKLVPWIFKEDTRNYAKKWPKTKLTPALTALNLGWQSRDLVRTPSWKYYQIATLFHSWLLHSLAELSSRAKKAELRVQERDRDRQKERDRETGQRRFLAHHFRPVSCTPSCLRLISIILKTKSVGQWERRPILHNACVCQVPCDWILNKFPLNFFRGNRLLPKDSSKGHEQDADFKIASRLNLSFRICRQVFIQNIFFQLKKKEMNNWFCKLLFCSNGIEVWKWIDLVCWRWDCCVVVVSCPLLDTLSWQETLSPRWVGILYIRRNRWW